MAPAKLFCTLGHYRRMADLEQAALTNLDSKSMHTGRRGSDLLGPVRVELQREARIWLERAQSLMLIPALPSRCISGRIEDVMGEPGPHVVTIQRGYGSPISLEALMAVPKRSGSSERFQKR